MLKKNILVFVITWVLCYYLVKSLREVCAVPRVLIVDDEPEICMGLKNYFPWENIGYNVAGTANNGAKALEILERNDVDVVISDIVMPVMNGIELIKNIRQRHPLIKTVLLSAHRDFEYAKEALEYGVKSYIVKPPSFETLMDVFVKIKSEFQDEQATLNANESPLEGDDNNIIKKAKKYIRENVHTTLTDTAAHVFLNPFYLSSYFKHQTGETFTNYLIRIRVEKAAEYLVKTNRKIYEISELVGYSNAHNFTRTFKAYYQITPLAYRRKFQTAEHRHGQEY